MITAAYLQVWMLLKKDPICKHFVQRILTPREKPTAAQKGNGQKTKTILKKIIWFYQLG